MKKEKKQPVIGKSKEKKDIYQFKDFIPSNLIDSVLPQQPVKKFSVQNIEPFKTDHPPNILTEEWVSKSPEEINKEIEEGSSDNSSLVFQDEDHLKITSNLPFSLILQTQNNLEWTRPNVYVLNYYLDHQIQVLYPKKNYVMTRETMKQYHLKMVRENALKAEMNKNKENDGEEEEEEENIDFFLKEDEEIRKINMYKELYGILSKKYEYKIVSTEKIVVENDEHQEKKEKEENFKRIKKKKETKKVGQEKAKGVSAELEKEKNNNNNTNNNNNVDESDKKYILVPKPSNIYIQNFLKDDNLHNSFYSWLSSIYQLIIDLNIPDIESGKSIFTNIYPQKDGVPCYNPKGKYIIKLYQHGKPRKIVIDDRIPCNRNFEYILPQCENVEELWPALFYKGLLKLNMYKIRHPSYYYSEEYMDTNILYSLTGMQVISLDLNPKLLSIFRNNFNIIDENSKKKNDKKFIALYNKYKTKKMNFNRTKSYFDIQEEYDFKNQINGTYINNFNLQQKNIIPFQKGDKILLQARERSGSIIEQNFFKFGQSSKNNNNLKKENNKKEKDKSKDNNKNIQKTIKDSILNIEENKESDEKQKINNQKLNKKMKFQRSPNKKQTTVSKDIPIPSGETKRKNKFIELIDKNNNLIYNYLYSVDDFFCNDDFNMERLKFLDFSYLKKDLQDKKVEFKRLPLDQKKKYLLDRKQLKLEKLGEKKRRIQSLKESGNNYNLIHVINQTFGIPKLNYFSEYSSENVELAKKCLLNGWEFPPPSIFEKEFLIAEEEQKKLRTLQNFEDKVIPTKTKKEKDKNKPIGLFSWTREMYEELIGGKDALSIYLTNTKVPKRSKIQDGGWITFEDICKRFNKLLIVQNTKFCYKENLYVDNTWSNYKIDEFHPSEDNNIFLLVKALVEELLSQEEINKINMALKNENKNKKSVSKKKDKDKNKKGEEEKNDTDISTMSDQKNNSPNSSILIIFEPLNEEFLPNKKINEIYYPYISIDLCEKDTNIQIKKNIILNKFYSVFYYQYLSKEKEYYIKINSGLTPFGYNLQIFSEFYKIQHISKNNFLKHFHGFQEFNGVTGIPAIEKNKNYMFAKISFVIKDISNIDKLKFIIDVKHELYYLKKYINIFLVKDNPYYKKEIESEKLFSFEGKSNSFHNNKISLNDEYYFVFYIKPEFDLPETEFNIKILYNDPNITMNEINNLDPFELSDIYYTNKDSILFSYFIYSSEKIYTTIDINFYHFKTNEKKQNNEKYEIAPLEKDENHHIVLELYQLTKEPSLDFIDNAMKFSYSNQGDLIKQWKFSNSISISNLTFIGDLLPDLKKKKNNNANNKNVNESKIEEEEKKIFPYVLLCYIDVQKLSDLNIPSDLGYIIRVYASNNIGFIKDKTKEEHEKLLKEKWEENDVGRGQLALKSRTKYLVYARNVKKEKLNENEIKILNEERQRRSANEIDHVGEEFEGKNNKNKKINSKIQEKSKNVPLMNKNKSSANVEEEESNNNILTKNIINHINKRARPLSMENIFGQKRPVSRGTKSKYIINFYDYSNKERTIYMKKLEKMPLLKNNNYLRNKRIKISDEKYREKMKSSILSKFEESENELKKSNENFVKSSNDLSEGIIQFNKNLNKQIRAQSINKISLLNRRKKLQDLIQRRLDIKKEMLSSIEEYKKIIENIEAYKKELNAKKGSSLNYEEVINIYKEAISLLGNDDNDIITFFKLASNIKEEEFKFEYERLKATNDKNKDLIIGKMIEDIENNKWNINNDFIEKLKMELPKLE